MGRRQLANVLEQRLAVKAELEREVIAQARAIDRHFGQERQQGLDLGGKDEPIVDRRIVERLDAEPIASAEEALLLFIPNREGEHAAEVIDAVDAPLTIGLQNDFGIGMRSETLGPEFDTQFDVVVDLAVERDPIAAGIFHRLAAGIDVDDAQAAMREADVSARMLPHALTVGTAMALQLIDGL